MSRTAIATWFNRPIMTRLYCENVDVTDGLFAPLRGHGAADRAPDRFGDTVGVAPTGPRQVFEGVEYGIAGDIDERRAADALFRNPEQFDLRIGRQSALFRHSKGHRDHADE